MKKIQQISLAATQDLDTVAQQRSDVTAAPDKPKKYGTKATLGRDRQK